MVLMKCGGSVAGEGLRRLWIDILDDEETARLDAGGGALVDVVCEAPTPDGEIWTFMVEIVSFFVEREKLVTH